MGQIQNQEVKVRGESWDRCSPSLVPTLSWGWLGRHRWETVGVLLSKGQVRLHYRTHSDQETMRERERKEMRRRGMQEEDGRTKPWTWLYVAWVWHAALTLLYIHPWLVVALMIGKLQRRKCMLHDACCMITKGGNSRPLSPGWSVCPMHWAFKKS